MHIDKALDNVKSISIDTRTIRKGDVFVAIKGKKFDGHDFVKIAFKKGASRTIVSKMPDIDSFYKKRLIRVKDTLRTLGDVAMAHRLKFDIPIVAVTGTNGKTTAKDMAGFVLSAKYNVLKNETSKNNLIGLPLTLLRLDKKHDMAILEMGMNHTGEIDRLSEIAKPGVAVITNIGPSHLEFLGTLKNVFMAKRELLKHISSKGLSILNKDDDFLRNIKGTEYRKIYFGIDKKCPFQAKNLVYENSKWNFSVGEEDFELPLFGKANIYNALVAIAIAREFGIDFSTIKKRIKTYRQSCPMRLEFKNIHGIEILDDSYNSNPLSMECAIDTLSRYDTDGKRIIVSGDMLELGKSAKAMHEAIGKTIASSAADILVTMGKFSRLTNKKAKHRKGLLCYHARSHSDAASFLKRNAKPGDVILVKGSRATEMERVIEEFKETHQNIRKREYEEAKA